MDEVHLIVLWEKARTHERRILEDIRRHMTVVAAFPQRWPGDPKKGFARFYGAKATLARSKTKSCGGGEFMSIIVRDDRPRYGWARTSRGTEFVNLRMLAMKNRYRRWVGGSHCVHSTISRAESVRDILILTGRTPECWRADVSTDGLAMFSAASEAVADPGAAIGTRLEPLLENADRIAELCARVFPIRELAAPREILRLPDSLYTELCFDGRTEFGGACEVAYLTNGRELLGEDWNLSRRFRSVAPQHSFRVSFYRMDGISERFGILVRERSGDATTLAEAVRRGLSATDAARIAGELVEIADALERSGVCHRNLRPTELLVGSDGHVRIRDFRFALRANARWETKWFSCNPRALAALGGGYRESAGVWNDRVALARCLETLPDFPSKEDLLGGLVRRNADVSCRVRFRPKYRAQAYVRCLKTVVNNIWRSWRGRFPKDMDLIRLLACVCGRRPFGDDGWRDLAALFRALNESGLPYAVIRNSEMLPDAFDSSLHGDIDFLVADESAVAAFMKARKVVRLPYRVHYELTIGGRAVRVDLRHVGDGYYCEAWERDILANRRQTSGGVFVPSAEDAFHALVYHAAFQKFEIAADYPGKIAALAADAGVSGNSIGEWTAAMMKFLRAHAYQVTRPEDRTVKYNERAVAAALKMV